MLKQNVHIEKKYDLDKRDHHCIYPSKPTVRTPFQGNERRDEEQMAY